MYPNMKPRSGLKFPTIIIFVSIIFLLSCSKSGNWPQFRGAGGNMDANGRNLPESWSTDTNVVWAYPINGTGWSSPVVWGNKVIFLSTFPVNVKERPMMPMGGPPPGAGRQGERPDPVQVSPQGNPGGLPPRSQFTPQGGPGMQGEDTLYKQDVYRWEVTCIDLKSGKELWKRIAYEGNPKVNKNPMNTYASETPVTDGKRIYAYFGMHGLYCYDMEGNLLWQKDLGYYKTQMGWGTGSSPTLHDGILYVQVDNEERSYIVALDAATGGEKWRAERDEKTNYSTPFIWVNKIRTELIAGGKITRSYNSKSGKIIWELGMGGDQIIPCPVADNEYLYIGNESMREKGYIFAVKAGAEGVITLKEGESTNQWIQWSTSEVSFSKSSPLLYKGLIYSISGRGGEITCTSAADGRVVYKEKINGVGAVWASPWAYNDKIFFYDEKGTTRVIKAGKKFELMDENILNDKFWASAAFAKDAIILRGVSKLYCIK